MTGVFLYTDDNIYENGFKSRSYYLKEKLIPIDFNQDISAIIHKLKEANPDYIFTYFHHDSKKLEEISKSAIPIVMELSDFWDRIFTGTFRDLCKKIRIRGVSTQCRCSVLPIQDYIQNDDVDIFWFKWGVDTEVMKDYHLPKIGDVYFSGKYSTYMSRRLFIDTLYKERSIEFYDVLPYPKSNIPYLDYAKNLNMSYIALGGCTQDDDRVFYKGMFIGNTFMRNLEIPACNACLLNTPFGDSRILGFRDGVNCILVDEIDKIVSRVKYYLDDKELLRKITRAGHDLVHKKYSSEMVVDEFIKELNARYN